MSLASSSSRLHQQIKQQRGAERGGGIASGRSNGTDGCVIICSDRSDINTVSTS